MSTRPQFSPYEVIPNANATPPNSTDMSVSITSAPTIIQKLSMISYECVWAGAAPVGLVSVETSNNFSLNADGTIENPGDWVVLPLNYLGASVQSVPLSGNAGKGVIDIDTLGTYALRLVYTATSGTGNLTVTINAKVA